MATSHALCSKPTYAAVGNGPATCDVPGFNGTPSGTGLLSIHSIGAPFTGSTVYVKNGTNQCVSQPNNGAFDFVAVGPIVQPSGLVGATLVSSPRGPDLSVDYFQGDDGSSVINRPSTKRCRAA